MGNVASSYFGDKCSCLKQDEATEIKYWWLGGNNLLLHLDLFFLHLPEILKRKYRNNENEMKIWNIGAYDTSQTWFLASCLEHNISKLSEENPAMKNYFSKLNILISATDFNNPPPLFLKNISGEERLYVHLYDSTGYKHRMPCLNLRPKENMKETFNTGQYTNKKELLEKILNSRSLLPEEKKLTKNVFYKDFIHENIVESIMSYFLDMDAYAQNYYKNRQWFGQVTYMLNVVLNHNWTIQNKWKEGWLITNTDQHHKIVYSLGDVTKECPSENNDLIVCTNVLPWLDNSTKGNYYSAKKIIFGSLAKEGLYLDEHGFSHRSQLITKF